MLEYPELCTYPGPRKFESMRSLSIFAIGLSLNYQIIFHIIITSIHLIMIVITTYAVQNVPYGKVGMELKLAVGFNTAKVKSINYI